MKAAIFESYGPPEVYKIKEIEKPAPKPDEVLIKIKASTAASADGLMRNGKPLWGRLILGIRKPKKRYRIPGIELSGKIVEIGEKISKFNVGDDVFAFRGFGTGTCAEFKCMKETDSIDLKPQNLTYEQAAASVDGATTAIFFLKEKAHLRKDQSVLIIGASGSIGSFAVQIARLYGARVTGVCGTTNVDLVKSLGADYVIDYSKTDYTKQNTKYDVIFDTVGKSSFRKCKNILNNGGCYLPTVGLHYNFTMVWTSLKSALFGKNKVKKVITGMSVKKNEALAFLKEQLEKGTIKTIVDKVFPLEQVVEAHRYVNSGHKKGNVVISINNL